MAEPGNLRFPVSSTCIRNRDFYNFEVLFHRPKNQIEISKGIKIAKIASICGNLFVMRLCQYLGAAQRVGEPLVQQPREQRGKTLIRDPVENSHRVLFHWIDKSGSINELPLALHQHLIELG